MSKKRLVYGMIAILILAAVVFVALLLHRGGSNPPSNPQQQNQPQTQAGFSRVLNSLNSSLGSSPAANYTNLTASGGLSQAP
jgi:hypothetical protein